MNVLKFMLIELLVVLSIIAVLMTLLLHSLASARATVKGIACNGGLRQIGIVKSIHEIASFLRHYERNSPYLGE